MPQKCSYPPRKIISKWKPRMSDNNPRPPSPIKKSNPRNLRPRSRTTVSTDYSGVAFHGFFYFLLEWKSGIWKHQWESSLVFSEFGMITESDSEASRASFLTVESMFKLLWESQRSKACLNYCVSANGRKHVRIAVTVVVMKTAFFSQIKLVAFSLNLGSKWTFFLKQILNLYNSF